VSKPRVLITGVEGFTGSYLAARMQGAGYEVHGLARAPQPAPIVGVDALHVCDLTDANALAYAVHSVRASHVAHLAAISFVPHGDVEAIYRTNLLGTRNLLEALLTGPSTMASVLLASSANIYGNASEGLLSENAPTAPANDYAVSKLAMEHMARLYLDRLPVVIARPFNYSGRGQAEAFLIPKIVGHVKRKAPTIELGALDSARDFSDVRNVVAYYQRMLETPAAVGMTFNVCSGKAFTVRNVLDIARRISGHELGVTFNPAFARANEVRVLRGDPARLKAALGDMPTIDLEETLRWMLEA
jgi:nucleoside-diphosphate-sugar epimerase